MGIYTDIEVVKGIENTHQVIYREISGDRYFDISNLNTDESKDEFLKAVLWAAWNMFYGLVTVRAHVLDKNTVFNQEYMSNKIHFVLSDYMDSKPEFLSNLLRVLYEYFFWTGRETSYSFLSHDVLTALHNNFGKNDSLGIQFQWIRDELSVALTQWMLTSDEFSSAKRLIIDVESAKSNMLSEVATKLAIFSDELKKETEASLNLVHKKYNDVQSEIRNKEKNVVDSVGNINSKLNEIKKLEEKIENLRSEYNFVGLSSGFDRIKEKKDAELRNSEVNYKNLFGCIFIAPVIAFLLHINVPEAFPKDYSVLFVILPFITIEMALIYFFRLSYLEAKAIRTQLVQIELRLSLCSFVDGYVDYRKKNGLDITNVLNNFDSLIFSPIQINDNNIPSMFDGADVVADFASKIMKNK